MRGSPRSPTTSPNFPFVAANIENNVGYKRREGPP
jgi:hypothetical protein